MNNNVEICPSYGEHITVNSGYTVWCDKCEWNIDPKSGDKKIGFFKIPPAFTLVLILLGCLSLPRLYMDCQPPDKEINDC